MVNILALDRSHLRLVTLAIELGHVPDGTAKARDCLSVKTEHTSCLLWQRDLS